MKSMNYETLNQVQGDKTVVAHSLGSEGIVIRSNGVEKGGSYPIYGTEEFGRNL
jgi:hypothetical protein